MSQGPIVALVEFSFGLTAADLQRFATYGVSLSPDTACRWGLCVADEWQGRGVGKALASASFEIARRFGRESLILWGGVHAANANAVQYYHTVGFTEVGRFTNDDGVACIDMPPPGDRSSCARRARLRRFWGPATQRMLTFSDVVREGAGEHQLPLVPVPGTGSRPFLFGAGPRRVPVEIREFHMLATPVTQELWTHVMGSNPAAHPAPRHPIENVSWDQITGSGGFLERINASEMLPRPAGPHGPLRFRLPSESEWEYAARGGPRWTDDLAFSGSNDVDSVAWYGPRFSAARRFVCRVLGWRAGWRLMGRFPRRRPTRTHEVATKAPNQLGLYDMSGNVWEWCQDTSTDDVAAVPRDGTPYLGPGSDRRLRGGCHHNWDIHCTVWFRYGAAAHAHDGCIGFRPVLAPG